jgi:predicted dienelactone hydrolase
MSSRFLRLSRAALASVLICGVCPAQPPAAPSTPTARAAAPAKLYKEEAGPIAFRTIDEEWTDSSRTPARTIPVRMFVPEARADAGAGKAAPEKFPVIVFSPGLGGSRINYAYFTRHLASHGYIVIILSHPGSDTAAALEWFRTHGEVGARQRPLNRLGSRAGGDATDPAGDDTPGGWLMTSINDPNNLRERPRDISFVIDRIAGHKTLGPVADVERIGVAGHSFGAYTAMAIGGMTVDLPESHGGARRSFRDKRVKAVLPMSPEGAGAMGIVAGAWDSFADPVLFLTGTRDYGSGGRSATWRRQAFEAIGARGGVDDYLFTLDGAGHMTFGRPGNNSLHSRLILSLGTAFMDAYVRGDAEAKHWLETFAAGKPAGCAAEFKPAPTANK